jgi:hypothetical protein
MSYSDIVATIAMIVSITAVPASGYLSYRYAIKGEKRKEINEIIDPIRLELANQIDTMSSGDYVKANFSRKDIIRYIDVAVTDNKLGAKIIDAFDHFIDEHSFKKLWRNDGGTLVTVDDTSNAMKASKELLDILPRR